MSLARVILALTLVAPLTAQAQEEAAQEEAAQEEAAAEAPAEEVPPPPSTTCAGRAREVAANAVVRIRSGSQWGAGFVYQAPNHVVTSFGLISLGQPITVVARDGSHHAARLLASDGNFDMAVLEVEHAVPGAQPLQPAPETSAMLGAPVVAIGHPFASVSGLLGERGTGLLRWSVNAGTVSAVNEQGIQADVALDEGHAGGALLDCEGRVLGLITGPGILSSNTGLVARIGRADTLIGESAGPQDFLGDLRLHFGFGGVLSIDQSGNTAGGGYLTLGATLFDRVSWMNRVGFLFGGAPAPIGDDLLSLDRTLIRVESMLGYRFFLDIGGFFTLYIVPSLGATVNHDQRDERRVSATPGMCTVSATESCIDIATTSTKVWSARPAIGITFIFGGMVEIGYTLEINVDSNVFDPNVTTYHTLNLGFLSN